MDPDTADALAAFRRFNYERIYMRPASVAQGDQVVKVLQALVEAYADAPHSLPEDQRPTDVVAGSPEALRAAVTYVGGMTDRYAFGHAISLLGWDPADLPRGIDWTG